MQKDRIKDAEEGAARQEEKRKTTEEIHGCRERGHAEGGYEREEDNLLRGSGQKEKKQKKK